MRSYTFCCARLVRVDELMGFVGFEDEGIAGADGGCAILVADGPGSGDDVVEFPLAAVEMVWVGAFAGGNVDDFDVERMALHEVGGGRDASERFGDFFARAGEGAFGGGPGFFF